MRLFLLLILAVLSGRVYSQNHSFSYGKIAMKDLAMKSFAADTSATAVFLNEFGEAYFDENDGHNLVFEYHAVIKILKKEGLEWANIVVDLHKNGQRKEFVRTGSVKASSYNANNGSIKETSLEPKAIHTVSVNEYWDELKFAIPNVSVGSIIEFSYVMESPFIFNFRNWEFQSDIPKVKSEYWATIPANYIYNITLRGYVPLTKNENKLIKDGYMPGGGDKADCSQYQWAIDNVPAFVTEEYMTAKSNFLSKVNFELSEVQYFDGRKDRVTKEWKDAEQELRTSDRFGQQLRRGKSIVDGQIDVLLANEKDPLVKAQKIYAFMQSWYDWDDHLGEYSELGIKKAFDQRKGNVGDINLSLIAALRYAEIEADPLLLSTRANGLPTELHPVLSDFNYVIAKVKIGDKDYLLDATDDFLPFGTIPVRCLNGKGRVFAEKGSYWYDLKTTVRARQRNLLTLKLDKDGMIRGILERTYSGYDAVSVRKEIFTAGSHDNFFNDLKGDYKGIDLTGYKIDNPTDLNKPVIVKLNLEWSAFESAETENFLFNPFAFERITANPFRSKERHYPVDFGATQERTLTMTLEYPQEFQAAEVPAKVGIAMPNASARYVFDMKDEGNKLSMQSYLSILKPVFTSDEYHFLKELYAQIVANQQTEILFKKKL